MSIDRLSRKLEQLARATARKQTRLPVIMLDDTGHVLYQYPEQQDQTGHRLSKIYIGISPDEDGIEP